MCPVNDAERPHLQDQGVNLHGQVGVGGVQTSDGVLDRRPLYDESAELLFRRLGNRVSV